MAGQQLAKRIPLIKFPVRHRPSAASSKPDHNVTIASPNAKDALTTTGKSLSSEVPASPGNLRSGGKASLQPRRAPISQKEIEAILLGGCF
ncbi:hypothetical protein O6H91_07G059300 [Diphasiastrum complanatum]|uniref:Uncharacterized protein n=1 Tax=Diphasiastrum complanatum TaxID=34168 RepID=A0ACC2D5P4_DIPCM|nr:hypothetical protein O6H91_07G059300 [Diphasiastrum complanatum]